MAGDVSIGRLVLDVPGLRREQAARLAEQIGVGLAGMSGEFDMISVTVDEADPDRLASRILVALLQRIG
jgi:hypothetical protein